MASLQGRPSFQLQKRVDHLLAVVEDRPQFLSALIAYADDVSQWYGHHRRCQRHPRPRQRRHARNAKERNRGQGKAVCWRTTQNFLDFFGLTTLDDLYRGNKLERFFGPVYGINGIDDNRNDDAAGDL